MLLTLRAVNDGFRNLECSWGVLGDSLDFGRVFLFFFSFLIDFLRCLVIV